MLGTEKSDEDEVEMNGNVFVDEAAMIECGQIARITCLDRD